MHYDTKGDDGSRDAIPLAAAGRLLQPGEEDFEADEPADDALADRMAELALEDELMTLRVRRPDPRLIKDLVAEAREELGLSNLGGTQSDLAGSPQAQREQEIERERAAAGRAHVHPAALLREAGVAREEHAVARRGEHPH